MRVLTVHELVAAYCALSKQHGVWLSHEWERFDLVPQAAPMLNFEEHGQALLDGHCLLVCDSAEERDRLYGQIVGDDGPTESNPYDGPVRVYALTFDDTGQMLNENT